MRASKLLTPSGLVDVGRITAGGVGYGPWVDLEYQNGWTSYNTSIYPPAQARFAPGGKIELRGLIKGGTATPIAVATLPSGMQPHTPYQHLLITPTHANAGVKAEGDVRGSDIFFQTGSVNWINLTGLWFYYEDYQGVGGDTGWIVPTLLNGWVNYGGSWQTVAYRKVNEIVFTRGFVKNGTIGTANPVFILPAGFRAAEMATFHSVGVSNSLSVIHHNVTSPGDFSIASSPGGNGWISISDISFIAEA